MKESKQCQNGETTFYCKNGGTTRCRYRCDGDDDCGDKSDEHPSVCPSNKNLNGKTKSKKVQSKIYKIYYQQCKN